ncbi:hypothetical protein [Halomonas sp. GXIMD04776]
MRLSGARELLGGIMTLTDDPILPKIAARNCQGSLTSEVVR